MMNEKLKRRNKQIEEHLQLVRPIALHYAFRTGQDKEDLTQVGMLGLIRAAQFFQSSKSVPFAAFAKPHIRGAILHYLRDSLGPVKIPRRLEERAQALLRDSTLMDSASSLEKLSAVDRTAIESYKQKGRWYPLDHQFITADKDQWSELVDKERNRMLMNALEKLDCQEFAVVDHVVLRGESLRSTASYLGISCMTVQRRVKRALRRLAVDCAELSPYAVSPLRQQAFDPSGSVAPRSL